MGKTIKLYINGVEKYFIRLHYRKDHPNQDPDTFDITMDEAETLDIVPFQTVEIKKDGVTEFYGFVEEVSPDEDAESGTDVIVTGRCWKLITWKKWNERFQESRDVGPEDVEGNIETGFFGSVNPSELFKFFIRCPISTHPKGHVRHKIGWGIPSDDWICCANMTAEARYPDWVSLRYTELSWRGRGTVDTFFLDTLNVDGFDYTTSEWVTQGAFPWLDTCDTDPLVNCIQTPFGVIGSATMANFTFANLDGSRVSVYETKLFITLYQSGFHVPASLEIYDGTIWHDLGDLKRLRVWSTQEWDVSSILNTTTKVNAAKVRFHGDWNIWGYIRVTCAYLVCRTGIAASAIAQQNGDWFAVNLGGSYNTVVGILAECRNNPICYPENYKIQYTTLSNCCDPNWPPLESEWTDIVSVANNTYRDILHSWSPIDNVFGIRIKITSNGTRPWEISQIYAYQADEDKYRLLDD